MMKRTRFKLCKNSHKNFLDKMTDMRINICWRRELDSAMCKNNHEEPGSMFMRFRFCRCMECDLFFFFLLVFFFFLLFSPCLVAEKFINWLQPLTERTTSGQGRKSFCRMTKRTRTTFKVWWENKIKKCAKITTRNLGPYDRPRDRHKVQTCSMQMYGTMLNTERTKSVRAFCDGE